LSVSVALAFHWSGRRARLFFPTRPDSYNTAALIAFLQDLKQEFRGRRVILVWDGLRAWLSIERLPGYAPELNPVEQLCGNVKGTEPRATWSNATNAHSNRSPRSPRGDATADSFSTRTELVSGRCSAGNG
jgi:hypothetical protein